LKIPITFDIEVSDIVFELVFDIEVFDVEVELQYRSSELQYWGGKDPNDKPQTNTNLKIAKKSGNGRECPITIPFSYDMTVL
jgi:hypothetical protein